MDNSVRIAAVIVTYNRKELLKENIKSLLLQDRALDGIIIIDNHSTDGTQEEVRTCFSANIDHIHYYYMSHNTCGAGGFEYGTRVAYEMGYDFIWLMDDDGRPMENSTLRKLVEVAENRNLTGSPFILNSMVLCDDANLTLMIGRTQSRKQVEEMAENDLIVSMDTAMINPFNGTLISRELVRLIGVPNGAFVIYGDESDYAYRALDAHAFVAKVTTSLYYHPRPSNVVKLFGKYFTIIQSAKWKYYYYSRNSIYRLKRRKGYWACIKKCLNIIDVRSSGICRAGIEALVMCF